MTTRQLAALATLGITLAAGSAAQPLCDSIWCDRTPVPGISHGSVVESFQWNGAPALFAGGRFGIDQPETTVLLVLTGGTWQPISIGADDLSLLKVLDTPNGPALFVGGMTRLKEDVLMPFLASFDGQVWTEFTGLVPEAGFSAIFTRVFDAVYFDAGSGPELFVGGIFRLASDPSKRSIGRYTANGFVGVGDALQPASAQICGVGALHVFSDTGGTSLFAGGNFASVGATPAVNIARWSGSNWSSVGQGLPADSADVYVVPSVVSLSTYVLNGPPHLLASGDIRLENRRGMALWDGTTWNSFGGDFAPNGVRRAVVRDLGDGPRLYAIGRFTSIDDETKPYFVARDGDEWISMADALASPLTSGGLVNDIEMFDDGGGPVLYAAGRNLTAPGGTIFDVGIARFGPVLADLNCDQAVTLTDLAILLTAFGGSAAGDINDDGLTDLADLAILLTHFGDQCGTP